MRWSLIYGGKPLALSPGRTFIGRSVGCKVVLDDSQVSRRHARVTVSDDGVVVEDLGSANGVFVNDERINGPRRLEPGDRLRIVSHVLEFVAQEQAEEPATGRPPRALDGRRAGASRVASLWDDDELGGAYGEKTALAGVFDMFAQAIVALLARGDVKAAEDLVQASLQNVLAEARAGHAIAAGQSDAAARCALMLARATPNSRWTEYVLELHVT